MAVAGDAAGTGQPCSRQILAWTRGAATGAQKPPGAVVTADSTELTQLSRMVAFALRWCVHGGGPAEVIRADFGMDTTAFFRTLVGYLDVAAPAPLRPVVVERMTTVARRRL
ncbi:hypothetical protein Rwratislav_11593 [Rhodococcus wratislaviensis IFP 2016]|nr:hypothetical protein Rwratislav_11593 [Rhodococcus wratislaviensis IFP 2016]